MKSSPPPQTESKYCIHCDRTGIVHNPYFNELQEVPLTPCPKCVMTKCKCGGEDPFYYFHDGHINECPCRETRMKIARIHRIYERSGIDKKFRWKRVSDFRTENNKLANEAKNAAYDLVCHFPNITKGLYLWGNPGTGKTLLASIILTELIIRHAVEGRFIKISRTFFKRIKETFVEGSPTYGESGQIERDMAEADVLIIDDFGVQRDSAWEQETLYNLVDARYEAEKFTVFTSNISPLKGLAELSQGRVLSRIKEMCRIMEISGPDFREKL